MVHNVSLPKDGTILATSQIGVDDQDYVQAKFVEINECHHEIRLYGHNGQNEFASRLELEVDCYDKDNRWYECNCYIQTGTIEDIKLHLQLLEHALRNLNTLRKNNLPVCFL